MRLPLDPNVRSLVALYEDADVRIQHLIREAIHAGIDPSTGRLRREGTANYYKRQLAEVRKVLAETQRQALPRASELIGTAYVHGVTYADEALGLTAKFSGVHRDAINVLNDNIVNRLNEAAVTVGRQTEDVFREVGLRRTAIGILEGSTREAVSNAMIDDLVHEGKTAFRDKRGRRWSLAGYTQMVARTTTREAVTRGTATRMIETGHDLVTISSHTHDHDECSDYDGKTFSMSGDDSRYPKLDRYPPFHPNCVHVLTPAATSFEDFERAMFSEKVTERDTQTTATAGDPFDEAAARIGRDPIDPTDVAALRSRGAQIRQESERIAGARKIELENRNNELLQRQAELNDAVYREQDRVLALPSGSDEKTAGIEGLKRMFSEQSSLVEENNSIIRQLRNLEQDTTLELLRRVRPGFGSGKLNVARKTKVSETVQEAARFMPREWIDRSNDFLIPIRTLKTKDGRGVYRSNGELEIREGDGSNAVHELSHRVEAVNPDVVKAERAFYEHRTRGEGLVKLKDLRPNSTYGPRELTRRDKFSDPYMGKDYGGDFFELLSMGMEGVFYRRHGLIAPATRPARIQKEIDKFRRALESGAGRSEAALNHFRMRLQHLEAQYPESSDDEYIEWILGVLASV